MVKFSDPIFQDAYLCSLRRQHDDKYDDNVLTSSTYQSTTNASRVANVRDIGYGEKKDDIQEEMKDGYQEDIYTSTTFKSGSNKHNQYHDNNNQFTAKQQQSSIKHKHVSPPPPPPANEEEVEEYITKSPIIQRSKQRQIERNSFLDWADSQLLGYKATSTTTKDGGKDDGSGKEGRDSNKVRGEDRECGDNKGREVREGGKSTRMKKLWDFNNIDTSMSKLMIIERMSREMIIMIILACTNQLLQFETPPQPTPTTLTQLPITPIQTQQTPTTTTTTQQMAQIL